MKQIDETSRFDSKKLEFSLVQFIFMMVSHARCLYLYNLNGIKSLSERVQESANNKHNNQRASPTTTTRRLPFLHLNVPPLSNVIEWGNWQILPSLSLIDSSV